MNKCTGNCWKNFLVYNDPKLSLDTNLYFPSNYLSNWIVKNLRKFWGFFWKGIQMFKLIFLWIGLLRLVEYFFIYYYYYLTGRWLDY